MAKIMCKLCGGEVEFTPGVSTAVCRGCGANQTVPVSDDQVLLAGLNEANALRRQGLFELAGTQLTALAEQFRQAEVYWALLLCKYGVIYRDGTPVRCSVCLDNVMEDTHFERVMGAAQGEAGQLYWSEARKIQQARTEEPVQPKAPASGDLVAQGNDALDKREWARAADCFDRALAADSRCAGAYLGRALIGFHVPTLQHLEAKLRTAGPVGKPESIQAFGPDAQAEEAMAQEAAEMGYPQADVLRAARQFDFTYPSRTRVTEAEHQRMIRVFAENDDLAQAESLGDAGIKTQIAACREGVLSSFQAAVAQSKAEDQGHILALRRRYADHIATQRQMFGMKKVEVLSLQETRDIIDAAGQKEAVAVQKEKPVKEKKVKVYREKKTPIGLILGLGAAAVAAVVLLVMFVIIPGNEYRQAEALLENGQYKEAIAAFEAMDGYKDSEERIDFAQESIQLERAIKMVEQEEYYEAMLLLQSISSDSDYDSIAEAAEEELQQMWDDNQIARYLKAEELAQEGNLAEAAQHFAQLRDFSDARRRSRKLWEQIVAPWATMAGGEVHTLGLTEDGGVVSTGSNKYGQCDVSEWSDIMAVGAGGWHTLLVNKDGTVSALGFDDYGQLEVSSWKNIVAATGGASFSVGLRMDGTVVATELQGDAKDYGQCDLEDWKNITAIAACNGHTLGLRLDGTVASAGYNEYGQCNVNGWKDIVAIAAGNWHSVGLKADGTVVTAGYEDYDQHLVGDWTDIVSVAAGAYHTVGLRSDGTVVAVGGNSFDQCEVDGWTDIIAIAAGRTSTLGLKADGTVVATGGNTYGQVDVDSWIDIKLPED